MLASDFLAYGALERIHFTAVRFGVFEYADDDVALVLTGDGRVPALSRTVHT